MTRCFPFLLAWAVCQKESPGDPSTHIHTPTYRGVVGSLDNYRTVEDAAWQGGNGGCLSLLAPHTAVDFTRKASGILMWVSNRTMHTRWDNRVILLAYQHIVETHSLVQHAVVAGNRKHIKMPRWGQQPAHAPPGNRYVPGQTRLFLGSRAAGYQPPGSGSDA